MIAFEGEFLKAHEQAHEQLEELIERVRQASRDGTRIDQVERTVFGELLAMGLSLLRAFLAGAGDGDVGPTASLPQEPAAALPVKAPAELRSVRRLSTKRERPYYCFGFHAELFAHPH